jgi:hypothetical protein
MMLCSLVNVQQCFRGKSCLHLQSTRANQDWKDIAQICIYIYIYIHTRLFHALLIFSYLDTEYSQFTDTLNDRLEGITSRHDERWALNIQTNLCVALHLQMFIIYKQDLKFVTKVHCYNYCVFSHYPRLVFISNTTFWRLHSVSAFRWQPTQFSLIKRTIPYLQTLQTSCIDRAQLSRFLHE